MSRSARRNAGLRRFCGCFGGSRTHGDGVSLNRCEQRLFDYLQSQREERQHWQQKVRSALKDFPDEHAASLRLEADLWRYYLERSAVAAPFKQAAAHEGLSRTSMRNLAELLLRLWTEPSSKPKAKRANNGDQAV